MELAFAVAAVALLLLTTLPLLGNSKLRSDRLVCGNNLRRIGVAFNTWADPHENQMPWTISQNEGGTAAIGSSLMDLAWYHYSALSNDLASPQVLACPSDNSRVATKWDQNSNGGFSNPAYRNNALSYLVGCHAEIRIPLTVLAADRNIVPDGGNGACGVGFNHVIQLTSFFSAASWNPDNLHRGMGNILSASGNVTELSSMDLRQFVRDADRGNGVDHYLPPR